VKLVCVGVNFRTAICAHVLRPVYLLSHENDGVEVGVKFVFLVMIKWSRYCIYVVVTCVRSIQSNKAPQWIH